MEHILVDFCHPFVALSVNNEPIRNNWNDRSFFFCTVVMSDSGKIIFSEMNPTYIDLIGHKGEFCGKYIYEVFDLPYEDHIRKMFERFKKRNSVIQYLSYSSRNDDYWKVTTVFENKMMHIIGQRLNMDTFKYEKDSRNEKYLGMIIVKYEGGKYIVDTCSDILKKIVSNIDTGDDLSRAAEKYLSGMRSLNIISTCISRGEIFDFYDIAHSDKDGSKSVHINIMPLSCEGKTCAAIGISVLNDIRTDVDYSSDKVAVGIVRRNNDSYYFYNVEPTLESMLMKKKLSEDEIFSSLDQSIAENKNVELISRDGNRFIINAKQSRNGSNIIVRIVRISNMIKLCQKKNTKNTRLTEHEEKMLLMAADGMTNRCIAYKFHVTEGTVKRILFNGYRKLGISSRIELVRYFRERGSSNDEL